MSLDDYADVFGELLPTLPLYLGVLVGAAVMQLAFNRFQRTVLRHGTCIAGCGLTGEMVARRLLVLNELHGVRLVCKGLRDLYHPWKREIRLNSSTFNSPSLGALAIAAHEVGHAQQFAERTFLCRVRQIVWPVCWALTGVAILFPVLSLFGVSWVSFDQATSFLLAIAVLTLLLQLPILLPLERDASNRAKRLAQKSGLLAVHEEISFDALLKSAWLTYAAMELQRWTLVMAAGIFLCYSPSLLGLENDVDFMPGSITGVHVAGDTDVLPPQPPAKITSVPPAMPPTNGHEPNNTVIGPLTANELLEPRLLTYFEAILPNLIILVLLLPAYFLFRRLSTFGLSKSSSKARAIERSNQGLALCQQGALRQAIAQFDQALQIDPKLAAALYNRGHTYLRMGRLDEALRDLDASLLIEPKLVHALVARGDVWQKRGDTGRALAEYDAAHRLAPQNPTVLACRGFTWLKKQDYERALADFDRALELNPQDAWSLAGRGLVWLAQDNHQRALAECDRAILIGGCDALPFTARGRVWLAKNDNVRAIDDFTEALRRESNDAPVLRDRGLAYYLENIFDLAVADLRTSVRIDPTDFVAWNNYGAALYGAGEYEEAAKALRESIRLNPTFPNPYKHLAWLQAKCPDVKLRDGAQAVANATRALELADWKPGEWFSVLAAAHAEAGNRVEAEKCEAQAVLS